MNIGNLDHRITIEQNSPSTHDAVNKPIADWSTLRSVWASIKRAPITENTKADKPTVHRTIGFTIRYMSLLNEKHRIDFESKKWNILKIETVGRNVHQVITAVNYE